MVAVQRNAMIPALVAPVHHEETPAMPIPFHWDGQTALFPMAAHPNKEIQVPLDSPQVPPDRHRLPTAVLFLLKISAPVPPVALLFLYSSSVPVSMAPVALILPLPGLVHRIQNLVIGGLRHLTPTVRAIGILSILTNPPLLLVRGNHILTSRLLLLVRGKHILIVDIQINHQ
jgi:hypothetical protein